MRVAFATCATFRSGSPDDLEAAGLLGADFVVWDDPSVRWDEYDRVVLRSTWDYSHQLGTFLSWCRGVGAQRLRNSAETVAFSTDKRYLQNLGLPTVRTRFVERGQSVDDIEGQVVIKPNISAGARDTGRFDSATDPKASDLIRSIHESGRVALIQPYLPGIEEKGETTIIYIGGRHSHQVRKAPFLITGDAGSSTQVRHPQISRTTASAGELELAEAAHEEISRRFSIPLYARIDLLDDGEGPVISELELAEPGLYLGYSPGAAARLADAVRAS